MNSDSWPCVCGSRMAKVECVCGGDDGYVPPKTNTPKALVEVTFHWSDEAGKCYECGLPAAFAVPLAYGGPNTEDNYTVEDKHKRCAVCAANDAVDGEMVVRILRWGADGDQDYPAATLQRD